MAVFASFAQEGQIRVERRQYLFTLLGALALILAMALFHRSYQSLLLVHQKVVPPAQIKHQYPQQLTQINPWSLLHRSDLFHRAEVKVKLN